MGCLVTLRGVLKEKDTSGGGSRRFKEAMREGGVGGVAKGTGGGDGGCGGGFRIAEGGKWGAGSGERKEEEVEEAREREMVGEVEVRRGGGGLACWRFRGLVCLYAGGRGDGC